MNKLVALTFDDGPNTTTTLEVIEKLKRYGVKASFFLIGELINEATKQSVQMELELGCEIANHSWTHSDMTKLSAEEIRQELKRTDEAIFELTGCYPRFFRPPYINVNETMVENIDLPYICGINGLDWEPEVSASRRAALVLEAVRDGALILLHDLEGNDKTVEALDIIIPALLNDGFEFVTVSEMFERKGIKPSVHEGYLYSYVDGPLHYTKH